MPTAVRESRWYEIRDVDVPADLSRIRILAVPYNTWQALGYGTVERVRPHTFDKSIREAANGLPLMLWHDSRSFPIGKSVKWSLGDPAGLIGEWQIDTDDVSQTAARKARDGYLTGASIGFQPIRLEAAWNDEDDWDDEVSRESAQRQVTHTEGRLLEVSLTPTPAYAGAQVQQVRSALAQAPVPERDTIRKVGMNADTQLAIRAFRQTAERLGRAAS